MNYCFCAVIITVLNASHSLKRDGALIGEGLEIVMHKLYFSNI